MWTLRWMTADRWDLVPSEGSTPGPIRGLPVAPTPHCPSGGAPGSSDVCTSLESGWATKIGLSRAAAWRLGPTVRWNRRQLPERTDTESMTTAGGRHVDPSCEGAEDRSSGGRRFVDPVRAGHRCGECGPVPRPGPGPGDIPRWYWRPGPAGPRTSTPDVNHGRQPRMSASTSAHCSALMPDGA
jgi:hypothetical protein